MTGSIPFSSSVRRCAVRRSVTPARAASEPRKGFRFDPGRNTWVKDDRVKSVVDVVIQPKSGPAYTVWPVMHADLTALPLLSVSPAEVAKLQQQGWVVLDPRLEDNFNYSHIPGSVNVPLFRYVEGRDTFDNIKRFALGMFAMKATERVPTFAEDALRVLGSKNAKIIVACDIGGTLSTKREVAHKVKTYEVKDAERMFGRESRSLKAAHALLEGGFKNLKHLDGGIQQWKFQGFELEGDGV